MIVDATTDAQALRKAVERLGGTVAWPDGQEPSGRAMLEVDVDDHDAAERLPAHWLRSRDDAEQDRADPGDIADFVDACSRGDRPMVQAIATRLFNSDASICAIERALAAASRMPLGADHHA